MLHGKPVTDVTAPGADVRASTSSARIIVEVVGWAVVSAVGFGLLYFVQRELFLNGLGNDPTEFPHPFADFRSAQQDLRRYWLLIAITGAAYVGLLLRVHHWGRLAWGAVAIAVLGHLVLLVARPSLSIDILSYLSHGYWAVQGNPYVQASAEVAGTPYGQALGAEGWSAVHGPTPYGPLWTHLEGIVYQASGGSIGSGLVMFKAVILVSVLGSAILIGLIARRLRPEWATVAVLAWLANPVVIMEFGADGHNDALAIFFALLAIWAALRGWAAVAVLALALGVLAKYTPVIFALPLLVILVRHRRSAARLVVELVLGTALAVGLGWWLWRPWWVGLPTLDGVRVGGTVFPSWSPAGWLGSRFDDPLAYEPGLMPPLILAGVVLLAVLAFSWRRTDLGAMTGCAAIAVVVLAVLPTYWPWYAGLALALLVVRPTAIALAQVVLITAGSRIAGPYGDLGALGYIDFLTMFNLNALWGITVPVAGVLLLTILGIARAGGPNRVLLAPGSGQL